MFFEIDCELNAGTWVLMNCYNFCKYYSWTKFAIFESVSFLHDVPAKWINPTRYNGQSLNFLASMDEFYSSDSTWFVSLHASRWLQTVSAFLTLAVDALQYMIAENHHVIIKGTAQWLEFRLNLVICYVMLLV